MSVYSCHIKKSLLSAIMTRTNSLYQDLIQKIKLAFVLSVSKFCAVILICLKNSVQILEHLFGVEKVKMLKQSLGHPTLFQRIDRPMSALQALMSSQEQLNDTEHAEQTVIRHCYENQESLLPDLTINIWPFSLKNCHILT